METKSPIFVKIEDYKDIIDILTLLKKKLKDAKGVLNTINTLKNEEDTELEQWNVNVEEIERKIEYINRSLFQ